MSKKEHLGISEEKKIQEELKNSEAVFKELFENSGDEIYLVETVSMKILDINKSVCESTGFTNNELIGEKINKIVPVLELTKNALSMTAALNGKVVNIQTFHKKKNGTVYPIEIKLKTIKHKGKTVFMAIARDLTERNLTKKNMDHYAHVFEESLNEIYLFCANSLNFTQVNEAAQSNIGYSMSELSKLTPVDLKPEFTEESYLEKIAALRSGEKKKIIFESIQQRKDSSFYNVEVHLQLIQHENEPVFMAIIIDITIRKKEELKNNIINAISRTLNSNLSLQDFCTHVFSELQRIKPFPNVYISNYNAEKNEIAIFFQTENFQVIKTIPEPRINGNGLSEYIIKTKKGLVLNRHELVNFQKKNNLEIYATPAKSWIGVPLFSNGTVVGVLACQCFHNSNIYTSLDFNLLSFIGTQIESIIERDIAEKEIKQFEKYFSVSMDMLCIANMDSFFTKINPKMSEVLGFTEHELTSKSFLEFIHPDDLEATVAVVDSILKGTTTDDFTNRYRCKNNEYKWFIWSSIYDPKTELIYAAARDITENTKSKIIITALAEIQDTFIEGESIKKSFEKMLTTLLEVTESEYGFIGEVLYQDKKPYLKTKAITDISWDKATSDYYKEHFSEGLEFRNLKTLFGEVLVTGKPIISNDPANDPKKGGLPPGHPVMNCFMGLPFYYNKSLIGMVGVANKPTGYNDEDVKLLTPFLSTCSTLLMAYQNRIKKLSAEEEVRKLADIVSHSSDAIISTDKNGNIVTWNLGAEKLLGYSQKEVIGTPIAILRPANLKEEHIAIIEEVKNGISIESYDTLQLKKGNILIDVSMSIFPLIDEGGEIRGISSILRDISVQKEAQQLKEEFTIKLKAKVFERTMDLEKTQMELSKSLEKEKELGELKSRFVSTASHQFRTPLTVIQASLGVLDIQKEHLDEKFKKTFEEVNDRVGLQIKKMTTLMDEVLILSKISNGAMQPCLESLDLITHCYELVSNHDEIQEDGRKMMISVHGEPYNVLLDVKLMEHALSNLISNAFKYSAGRPAPSISLDFRENELKISITDKGVGIPEREVSVLFEPFYRASNALHISGTGLGTAIAKEYIELLGGTISVESQENVGSTFTINLKK
ncbi:MAG: PAS domain S-box-containing protein [Crocinitomicaceae bacterium]|jgi:PAS domain S-box-containing protein